MSSERIGYNKADISFYKGYVSFRSSYRFSLAIHILEVIMLAVFIPIDCKLLTVGDMMVAALAIAAVHSGISLLIVSYQYNMLFVKFGIDGYCQLARDTQHSTEQQILTNTSIQSCTSEAMLHIQTGVTADGVDERTTNLYGSIAKSELQIAINNRFSQVLCWSKVQNFLGFISMFLVVIFMAGSGSMNPAEIAILTVYLILEAVIKFKILVILLVLVLSPIICLVLCFYACCCKNPSVGNATILDLPIRRAGMKEIINSGGECSICLQSINKDDQIYELRCSQKHVFHSSCLEKWLRVKTSCPNCRADLPMRQGLAPPEQLYSER